MAGTHWKSLTEQKYIGAWALDGQDMVVTIKTVRKQQVTLPGGTAQDAVVATLEGHKPLVLNETNKRTLDKLFGGKIEDWMGKQITLYPSTTSLKGEVVPCIRIRPQVPGPRPKVAITPERFSKALEAVKAGTYTADKLREQYELTPEQMAQLEAIEGA